MKSVPLIVRVNLISMQAGAVFLSTINIEHPDEKGRMMG